MQTKLRFLVKSSYTFYGKNSSAMSSGKREAKGPAIYTHWKRPHTRMYDYNYQVAESYYKPQVQYIGYMGGPSSRRARRRSVEPPPAQSFQER